jgi:hypothetical protein
MFVVQLVSRDPYPCDGADFQTLCVAETFAEAERYLHAYLPRVYGGVAEAFDSVTTHVDHDGPYCGGLMVEAEDMEGGTLRLWIDEVPRCSEDEPPSAPSASSHQEEDD